MTLIYHILIYINILIVHINMFVFGIENNSSMFIAYMQVKVKLDVKTKIGLSMIRSIIKMIIFNVH